MKEKNGLDVDRKGEAVTSSSRSPALETEAGGTSSGTNGNGDTSNNNTKEEESTNTKTVPFYKLFSFVDSFDVILKIVGTIGAVGNGMCLPIMTLLFGELIDSFGQNQNNKQVVRVVSKVKIH